MKLLFLSNRVTATAFKPARTPALFAVITALFFVGAINNARAQFTFASDSASDSVYSDGWTTDDNGGFGFNSWSLTNGANSGGFIGNPSSDGMGTSGIGTTAFGTFATGVGYRDSARTLSTGMQVGDTFSFYWAMNFDAGGGAKGFDLTAGGSNLFNVNNGGSSTITTTGGGSLTGYGTTPMLVTIVRSSASSYSFTMTSRSGGATFSTNISSTASLDGFKFYIGNQNDGAGEKNVYFNNFSVTNSGVFEQGGSVTNANRFTGTGNLSVGNSTTLALNGAGNNNYTGTTTINSGSILRFQGAGTSDFASAISGAGSLVISNSGGVLNLGGNNSGFTGTINIAAGILEARTANALGTTGGSTTVANGATLKIFTNSTGFTLADNISISGVGVGSIGAINNTGGNNTLSGGITLSGNSRINADTTGGSGSLTISGNVGGGDNVLFVGALGAINPTTGGNVVISGVVSGAGGTESGTTSIFKDGIGALTLSSANTYSGATLLNAGTILIGNNAAFGTGTVQAHFADFSANKILASTDGTARIMANALNIFGSNLTLGAIDRTGGLTFSGNVSLGNDVTGVNQRTLTTVAGTSHTFGGVVSGNTSNLLIKSGTGTLTLNGNNTFNAGLQLNDGAILVGNNNALGTGIFQVQFDVGGTKTLASSSDAAYTLANNVNIFNTLTLGQTSGGTGSLTLSGAVALGDPVGEVNSRALTVNGSHTSSGVISGGNGLVKAGSGTLTLSGASANTYSGATTINAGVLNLNKTTGNAIVGNVTVNSGATLLLSGSNQVASAGGQTVTLSGGTIQRASGVTEVFGNLNVTQASFIDFSGGTGNSITFTGLNYTPSALLSLQLVNFTQGNTLVFQNSTDMSSLIGSGFTFGGTGGFGSTSFSGSTFTITAIPEPSTYVAAAGLLALFLWPVRRRLIKDAKSILGLRPTGRDRIEVYRNA